MAPIMGIWPFLFFMLFIRRKRNEDVIRQIVTRRRKGEIIMNSEIVRHFIGKKCDIHSMINTYEGYHIDIKDVVDNWLICEDKGSEKLINLEYVIKIEEIPEKKK